MLVRDCILLHIVAAVFKLYLVLFYALLIVNKYITRRIALHSFQGNLLVRPVTYVAERTARLQRSILLLRVGVLTANLRSCG